MAAADPGRPVFVVEDDGDARVAVILALQSEGYDAIGAASGEEALRLLRSGEVAPSVILLDLMMPGMNGWQVREALMRDADIERVPVIWVSGLRHSLESLQMGAMRGAAALAKPFDMDQLLAAIRKHRLES